MAAQFAGKWDLLEISNAEEILSKTGVANEFLELAKKLKESNDAIVENIEVDGDKMTITYYKNGEKVEDGESFTVGSEVESETVDGRKVKVASKIDGNKLIFVESGPYDMTTTMEINGNTATTTMVAGGVTSTAKLQKL